MGVKKGYVFLNKFTKIINFEDLDNEIIAIDFNGLLHRFMRKNISNKNHYILEIINVIEKFNKYNIIPLFVIDGKPIPEKNNKNKKIREKALDILDRILNNNDNVNVNDNVKDNDNQNKEDILNDKIEEDILNDDNNDSKNDKKNKLIKKSISITKEDIEKCKDLLKKLDCFYIHINNYEADTILALLVKFKIIKYVYSEDFDMCLYNDIEYILKSLDYDKDTFKFYDKKEILTILNISSSEFIDIGFLTGTDFNHGLYKSTMDTNLELIKKYKTIENVILNIDSININRPENTKILIPTYNFNYVLVRDIFNLNNINEKTYVKVLKYNNEYNISRNQKKNTLSNLFGIKSILDYIDCISSDIISKNKYCKKIINYCHRHFGIKISIGYD